MGGAELRGSVTGVALADPARWTRDRAVDALEGHRARLDALQSRLDVKLAVVASPMHDAASLRAGIHDACAAAELVRIAAAQVRRDVDLALSAQGRVRPSRALGLF